MARLTLLTACLIASFIASVRSQCPATGPAKAGVLENSPVGTLVLNLTGPNPPSDPVSTISSDLTYGCYFHSNTSGIYMAKVFDLEFPTSCSGGNISNPGLPIVTTLNCESFTSLVISITKVDEFDPYFIKPYYSFTVAESDPAGTAIYTFKGQVADRDHSSTEPSYSFAILNESIAANMFTTTYNGGGFTAGVLRIQQALDFDAGPSHRDYTFNLSATDNFGKVATTTIYINVSDVDDLSPRFSQDIYRLSFVENETSQLNVSLKTVPELYATDMDIGINQTIGYTIQSGSVLGGETFLAINSSTGQFLAYQTDKPETRIALATVIVTVQDKNDNDPVVSPDSVTTSIAENSAVGTYVTRLAVQDRD
uniref:Cadherin domain-containing protein n=1 Tax=Macrostomum lignano TaxID=282301 RepID=A0A1I8FJW6_9PLAT